MNNKTLRKTYNTTFAELCDSIVFEISTQIRNKIWYRVDDQVWDSAPSKVRGQVKDLLLDQIWNELTN